MSDAPLKNVSLDTFAIMTAIIFTAHRQDMLDQKDWLMAMQEAVTISADLITLVQRFDWEKHEEEIELPKGDQ